MKMLQPLVVGFDLSKKCAAKSVFFGELIREGAGLHP